MSLPRGAVSPEVPWPDEPFVAEVVQPLLGVGQLLAGHLDTVPIADNLPVVVDGDGGVDRVLELALLHRLDEVQLTIERLADLHKRGVLTDDEFKTKKAELLGRL